MLSLHCTDGAGFVKCINIECYVFVGQKIFLKA